MKMKIYKIYPASQYDNLDLSLFHTNIEWKLDQTQFIVQFNNVPEDGDYLTHEEALAQVYQNPEWGYEPFIDAPDDENNDEYNEIDTDAN